MNTYQIAGQDRQLGAIGVFEPFLIELEAGNVDEADLLARKTRQDAGREHILLVAIVARTNTNEIVAEIGNAYWRARSEPGGTIEIDKRITHSEKAADLSRQMDDAIQAGRDEVSETLLRIGVPEALVKVTAGHADLRLTATKITWTGHGPEHGVILDQTLRKVAHEIPGLRYIEEWSDAFRWAWTDDDHIIVTYCEGDLTGEYFFSAAAYQAAYAAADEFYQTH